jgi:hypothetical protein
VNKLIAAFTALASVWILMVTLAIADNPLILPPTTAPLPPCDLVCLEIRQADLKRALATVEEQIAVMRTPIKTEHFWVSLDVSQDLVNGLYTSVGISIPLGPLIISPGYWWGSDNYSFRRDTIYHGFYITLGHSWTILD